MVIIIITQIHTQTHSPVLHAHSPFVFPPELKNKKNKKKTKLFPTERALPFKKAQIIAVLTTVNYVSWFSSGRN